MKLSASPPVTQVDSKPAWTDPPRPPVEVWNDTDLSRSARRLYARLTWFVRPALGQFTLWPSNKLLAKRMRCAVTTVERLMLELRKGGYITQKVTSRGRGKGVTRNVRLVTVYKSWLRLIPPSVTPLKMRGVSDEKWGVGNVPPKEEQVLVNPLRGERGEGDPERTGISAELEGATNVDQQDVDRSVLVAGPSAPSRLSLARLKMSVQEAGVSPARRSAVPAEPSAAGCSSPLIPGASPALTMLGALVQDVQDPATLVVDTFVETFERTRPGTKYPGRYVTPEALDAVRAFIRSESVELAMQIAEYGARRSSGLRCIKLGDVFGKNVDVALSCAIAAADDAARDQDHARWREEKAARKPTPGRLGFGMKFFDGRGW